MGLSASDFSRFLIADRLLVSLLAEFKTESGNIEPVSCSWTATSRWFDERDPGECTEHWLSHTPTVAQGSQTVTGSVEVTAHGQTVAGGHGLGRIGGERLGFEFGREGARRGFADGTAPDHGMMLCAPVGG